MWYGECMVWKIPLALAFAFWAFFFAPTLGIAALAIIFIIGAALMWDPSKSL